ncbi:MAG: hypothetical protein ACP5T9_03135 [Thermoplasmata archaeon]
MKNEKNNNPCKNKIWKELESHMNDYRKIFSEKQDEEDIWDIIENIGLSFSKEIHYKLELSAGGPSDYFDFVCNENKKLLRVEYHYNDWGCSEFVEIYREEDIKLLKEIFEYLSEGY